MRLYMVRHGQTSWNIERKAQGHTDIPLDSTGERQAELVGQIFRQLSIGTILTSDLQRAHQTAQAIHQHTQARLSATKVLREQGFGDWEGQDYNSIRRNFESGPLKHETRPPGGESKQDVWQRLLSITQQVRESFFDTVIVSHGGVSSLLMAQLLGGTIDQSASFKFQNASVSELERLADGRFKLIRYDDTSHLASLKLSEATAHGTLG